MNSQPFDLIIPFVEQKLNEVEWVKAFTPDKENPKAYKSPLPRRTNEMKTIRLDIEFSKSDEPSLFTGLLTEDVRTALTKQVSPEIADLLVNGDFESSDPLLMAFDGEEKTGKRLSNVNFSGVVYHTQYNAKNESYEWIVYVALEPVYD